LASKELDKSSLGYLGHDETLVLRGQSDEIPTVLLLNEISLGFSFAGSDEISCFYLGRV
jgi:hypothetical protein